MPDGGTHPVWHVWHDDGDDRGTGPAAYVVSGPGEQPLPWLPDEVELILRSKDTGGRLITVHATAREVTPEDPDWDAAVEVLRPERLNAVGDTAERWRQSCTIHLLTPHGRLVEGPGHYAEGPAPRRCARRPARPAGGGPGTGGAGPARAATPAPDRAARGARPRPPAPIACAGEHVDPRLRRPPDRAERLRPAR